MIELRVPAGVQNSDVEVEVIIHPAPPPLHVLDSERAQWRKFVEETAGKWQGKPLVRPPQGDYEKREQWG